MPATSMRTKPANAGRIQGYVVRKIQVWPRYDVSAEAPYPAVTRTTCAAMSTSESGPSLRCQLIMRSRPMARSITGTRATRKMTSSAR